MNTLARRLDAAGLETGLGVVLGAGALSLAAGVAAASGFGLLTLGLAVFAVACLVAIRDWRWSVLGLLAYLPVSGIPTILTYPNTGSAVLLKDFLFVVPAYVGFLAFANARRTSLVFAGAPVVLMAMFALLVAAQTLNPSLPNAVVGLIGTKVWLLYVPLFFLGHHLLRTREDLERVLRLMALTALLPLAVGILEAILVNGGQGALVYRFYGDAAAATTQDFNQFNLQGGGSIRRVSSTFSFVTQYYTYAASMVAVSYAWWRGFLAGTGRAWVGRAVWTAAIVGAFLSGARGAILFVPLLVLLTAVFEGKAARFAPLRVLAPVALLVTALSVFKTPIGALLGHVWLTLRVEFGDVVVNGFRDAVSTTFLGLGSGVDTGASRHAYASDSLFTGVGGRWYEAWWVKAILELGVPGFVLLAALVLTIVVRARRAHRRLADPRLRAVSAALVAFLVWNVLYGLKGAYVDIDPINVYFWLFAGMLTRLPALDRDPALPAAPAAAP